MNKSNQNDAGSPALEYRNRIKSDAAAKAYKHRKGSKDQAERQLVEKALPHLPASGSVLDAPCGNGRMTALLAQAGFRATGVDLSDGTLAISREEVAQRGLEATFLKRDLESLEMPEKHFDGALCFRFFHHLPTAEVRARVVAELCRVTKQTILISYMSPWSPTMLKRRVRHALGGKKSKQHPTCLPDLEALMSLHGFKLREDFAQKRWLRSLHLACFEAATDA